MKPELVALISEALEQLVSDGVLAEVPESAPQIDRPKDSSHGDLSCNIAMVLAKRAGMAPKELAPKLIAALPDNALVDRQTSPAPALSTFVSTRPPHRGRAPILEVARHMGGLTPAAGGGCRWNLCPPIQQAPPRGPRAGRAIGDSLGRLLEATGWSVQREFYYNDAGQQINNLALSVQARALGKDPEHPDWPADGYQGGYIEDVASAYLSGETVQAADREITGARDPKDLNAIRDFAVACLRREQDQDLKAFQVIFDEYFLESSLYDSGAVEETVETLHRAGHTYEEQDALWLRTTDFGDDKDRVMRKSEGAIPTSSPMSPITTTNGNAAMSV